MTIEPSFWTLLPPLIAIALAVRTRQVHLSLLAGIWIGMVVISGGDLLAATAGAVDAVIDVATGPSNARVLFFCLLIGPLVRYLETFEGVKGLVALLERRGLVSSPRGARVLAWLTGVIVFIETNVTLLVTGAVGRSLFDRHRLSREKLAYLADSTSSPVCVLIPFNAWGALILGLLETQDVPRPLATFAQAVPLNLYAVAALVLAGVVAWTGWSPGPMRATRARSAAAKAPPTASGRVSVDVSRPSAAHRGAGDMATQITQKAGASAYGESIADVGPETGPPRRAVRPRAFNMIIPLAVMIGAMPLGLYITGAGDIGAGSGSMSALWAVLAGNAAAWVLILAQRFATVGELVGLGIRGTEPLLSPVLILLLSMTLGEVCLRLGTGAWLAGQLQAFPHAVVLLPATFVVAAIISFATGTSWGTFAMTIPIAVPAAAALTLPVAPFLAACLSGGIFGDHASPISDTTVVASLATGTDVIDHVRTQMPYALLSAGLALAGFIVIGATL